MTQGANIPEARLEVYSPMTPYHEKRNVIPGLHQHFLITEGGAAGVGGGVNRCHHRYSGTSLITPHAFTQTHICKQTRTAYSTYAKHDTHKQKNETTGKDPNKQCCSAPAQICHGSNPTIPLHFSLGRPSVARVHQNHQQLIMWEECQY